MLDEKDLQAIAQLMDKKLEPISARLDKLEAKVDQQKTELQADIKDAEKRMMALMEGYFDPKFNLLADGHKLIIEQMAKQEALEDLMESVEDRLDVLDSIVKLHSHEIAKLKKAQ